MDNYKGHHYDNNSEFHSYEGGAHFKYSDLCSKLKHLIKSLPRTRREDEYVQDNQSTLRNSFSRNKNSLIKSYSQKQFENKERNDYNYPQLNNQKMNNKKDNIKSVLHPKNRSGDFYPMKELINIDCIGNKIDPRLFDKSPPNVNPMFPTRNNNSFKIIGNISSGSVSQQSKNLVPIPSTTSYSTKNIFSKKLTNSKKTPCSLIKLSNFNSSLNHNLSKHDLSCLDEANSTYIKEKDDYYYNKMIFKINSKNGNSSFNKSQINYSFVNNINSVNMPMEEKTRNKPNESVNFHISSKKNLISLYRESNDQLLSNKKSKQLKPFKNTNYNFDFSSGYNLNNSKNMNMSQGKQFDLAKKSTCLQKEFKFDNSFIINNDLTDELTKKFKKRKEIDYRCRGTFRIGCNMVKNNISNVSSTRNHIPCTKNLSNYGISKYKMDSYLSKK